jgi:hypothetical protein
LRERADLMGSFTWTIDIELDRIVSTSMPSLIYLFLTLADLVSESSDRRRIVINWRIRAGADNMRSVAESIKSDVAKPEIYNFVFAISAAEKRFAKA